MSLGDGHPSEFSKFLPDSVGYFSVRLERGEAEELRV